VTTAFPLQWPAGVLRTRNPQRSAFGEVTIHRAAKELTWEIERMRGRLPVISTNLELRGDGLPYARQRPITDNGVAVYFTRNGRQMVFACDRWDRIEHNMRAITKTIEAMRGIERWGSSDLMERAFSGFEALPAPDPWWMILGLSGPTRSEREIKEAYRRASNSAHPDRPGGSHDRMSAVNAARDEGLKQIGALATA
jgi:hypothetical protein